MSKSRLEYAGGHKLLKGKCDHGSVCVGGWGEVSFPLSPPLWMAQLQYNVF